MRTINLDGDTLLLSPSLNEGGRYRVVLVVPEIVAAWMYQGHYVAAECIQDGMPEDARYVGILAHNAEEDPLLGFVFSHPSWDEVPIYGDVPIQVPVFRDLRARQPVTMDQEVAQEASTDPLDKTVTWGA